MGMLIPTEAPSESYGGRPKRLAIGIAPLGVVSIGLVPMES
jgi:hypothetical protein